MNNYIRTSLETHLFFGRIMKEHVLREANHYLRILKQGGE